MIPLRVLSKLLVIAAAVEALQTRPIVRPDSAGSRRTPVSSLFSRLSAKPHSSRRSPLFMSTEESPEQDIHNSIIIPEETDDAMSNALENAGTSDDNDNSSQTNSSSSSSGGLTRTLLLAAPLFCKFVIVLFIKFLTDLVVFPLLFLYRLARLVKRRILKALFSGRSSNTPKGLDGRVNGSTGDKPV